MSHDQTAKILPIKINIYFNYIFSNYNNICLLMTGQYWPYDIGQSQYTGQYWPYGVGQLQSTILASVGSTGLAGHTLQILASVGSTGLAGHTLQILASTGPTKSAGLNILASTSPTKSASLNILASTGPTKSASLNILASTGPTKSAGLNILASTGPTKSAGHTLQILASTGPMKLAGLNILASTGPTKSILASAGPTRLASHTLQYRYYQAGRLSSTAMALITLILASTGPTVFTMSFSQNGPTGWPVQHLHESSTVGQPLAEHIVWPFGMSGIQLEFITTSLKLTMLKKPQIWFLAAFQTRNLDEKLDENKNSRVTPTSLLPPNTIYYGKPDARAPLHDVTCTK
ncbi:hypothetical protein EV424DRAFT_1352115 [Suillus variegatus]|nr:hypothetical protein EV424DRAFT_1352115 [Suillus variegatus]